MNDSCHTRHEPANGPLSTLLTAARVGADSELGQLFEATRRYLLLIANRSLDAQLQQKVAASDLVQETFLDAHRDFQRFVGDTEADLLAWLCEILRHKVVDAGRKYRGTEMRNLAKERSLEGCANSLGLQVACQDPSPSAFAVSSESERLLTDAMEQLPADYQRVIELRNLQRLPFAEVGRRMGRSEDAAGKLWFRAIQKLREGLAVLHESRCSISG